MGCSENKKCPYDGNLIIEELKKIHPEIDEKCIPGLINLIKNQFTKNEECCKELECCKEGNECCEKDKECCKELECCEKDKECC